MADIFDYAQCREVFYDKGTFPYAENTKRFIRAPFRMLTIPGNATGAPSLYLEPTPAAGTPDALWGGDSFRGEQYLGREGLGYLVKPELVVGEYEMGDFAGKPDTWKGVHAFGML